MILERVETCTSEGIYIDGVPIENISFPEIKNITAKAISLISNKDALYYIISQIIDTGHYESSNEICDCCGDSIWNKSWVELKEEI